MSPDKKIIERIRKLLAMASHAGSNQNEAATAMKRAHSLLAQYNLSLADMTAEEQNSSEPYVSKVSIFKERFRPYGRTIAAAIAKLNFCKMFYSRSERCDTYTIVGRATNVEIAVLVIESVLVTLVAQAKRESAGSWKPAGFQTNFMSGAASTIDLRCEALIEEASSGKAKIAIEDDSDSSQPFTLSGTRNLPALRNTYVAELKGADDFIAQGMGIKLRVQASRAQGGRGGHEGAAAGAKAGRSVNLRPGAALGHVKNLR